MTGVDFQTVAEVATQKYKRAMLEAGRQTVVPDGPVYSPFDVECILAAALEAAGTLRQEREREQETHDAHYYDRG